MITPNTPLDQLFPHKWMKPKDLTDAGKTTITGRLTKVTIEEVKPQPSQPKEQRLALWLAGHKPYLVTSRTDTETLARYGATTPADLVGKTIAIKLDTFRDQVVLRIAPPPPDHQTPKPGRSGATNAATAPATSAPPAATTAPEPEPPAATRTPAAQPVAATAAQPAATAPSTSGGVQVWPPREPWVSRFRTNGEVDWASTFWLGSAALGISRADAKTALERHGGSLEDAIQEIWERSQASHTETPAANDDELAAILTLLPAADPCPHGFASSCPEGCN